MWNKVRTAALNVVLWADLKLDSWLNGQSVQKLQYGSYMLILKDFCYSKRILNHM